MTPITRTLVIREDNKTKTLFEVKYNEESDAVFGCEYEYRVKKSYPRSRNANCNRAIKRGLNKWRNSFGNCVPLAPLIKEHG